MSVLTRPSRIGLVLFLVLSCSLPVRAENDARDYPAELAALRTEFVKVVRRSEAPELLAGTVLSYTARAWALGVQRLAERYHRPAEKRELENRVRSYLHRLDSARRPEDRQALSMELLYDSLESMAGLLAARRRNRFTGAEIRSVAEKVEQSLDEDRSTGFRLVTLGHGCLSLLALSIQTLDSSGQFSDQINMEMNLRVGRTREIRKRKDLHNQGRYFLMAQSNFRGCFNLVCLFNLAWNPRSAPEVESIKASLERHLTGKDRPARNMILILTALAEASFPAAMSLASK
ncbi:MAG: hypothetical protein KKB20_22210 [Proteobacteria bacterium]|nr:hypothetical protein [Pseudomonadota bacterium]